MRGLITSQLGRSGLRRFLCRGVRRRPHAVLPKAREWLSKVLARYCAGPLSVLTHGQKLPVCQFRSLRGRVLQHQPVLLRNGYVQSKVNADFKINRVSMFDMCVGLQVRCETGLRAMLL